MAMAIATVNPATGVTEKTFDPHDDAAVDKALARSADAFSDFSVMSFQERSRLMVGAAELFEGEVPDIARVMTTEMGKTFAAAKGEVAKCANALRWFAEHAESMLADEVVKTAASDSRALYRPLGPVLAVMPWNFPLWQVIRFAAPALMLGNTGLLKHSSNVPQTSLIIEDVFRRAGYPDGVFQTLLVESRRVAPIIADDRVKEATRSSCSSQRTSHALRRWVSRPGSRTTARVVLPPSASSFTRMSTTPSPKLSSPVCPACRSETRWTRPPRSVRSPLRTVVTGSQSRWTTLVTTGRRCSVEATSWTVPGSSTSRP
jgi:acyl-CoA reductase-like NAD-dependent aldehyde dehydrogenase